MSNERAAHDLVEHFFRHAYGRLLAALVRALGADQFDLAEESVQEALARAVRVWPMRGVPERPEGWLLTVARNHARDVLRRRVTTARVHSAVADGLTDRSAPPRDEPDEPRDDRLRMIFLCCHPDVPRPARVALTLKAVCGFSIAEIARAFRVGEPTIAQRIVRAKRALRGASFSLPDDRALHDRLGDVLDVCYLLFAEGYSATSGDAVVRHELLDEALRLGSLLVNAAITAVPESHALLALMSLQASRRHAREDGHGEAVPLHEQDRALWDQASIARGLRHLEAAGTGETLSEFHLLAGIAACHATSASVAATDWARLVEVYAARCERNARPLLALNRAVAVSYRDGPAAGLALFDSVGDSPVLRETSELAAAYADANVRLGDLDAARDSYSRAAALATNDAQRRAFAKRAALR